MIGIERHRVQRARRRSEREEVDTCCDSFFAASLSFASWACLLVFGPISTASARFRHISPSFAACMQAFEQHGWRPLTRQQSGRKARQQLLSEALAKGSLGFCNKIVCAGEGTRMRDRQQVNIGRSASHTHTLQQKAGVMRLRFFMSRRPSVRLDPSSNAPSQAGGIGRAQPCWALTLSK